MTQVDPRKADVAKLRLFIDLEVQEIAAALHAPELTVQQDWAFAKAWLSREIRNRA